MQNNKCKIWVPTFKYNSLIYVSYWIILSWKEFYEFYKSIIVIYVKYIKTTARYKGNRSAVSPIPLITHTTNLNNRTIKCYWFDSNFILLRICNFIKKSEFRNLNLQITTGYPFIQNYLIIILAWSLSMRFFPSIPVILWDIGKQRPNRLELSIYLH